MKHYNADLRTQFGAIEVIVNDALRPDDMFMHDNKLYCGYLGPTEIQWRIARDEVLKAIKKMFVDARK